MRLARWGVGAVALGVVCALALTSRVQGQIRYSTGQNAAPIFEGWQRNPDGTISMVFGYLNRNYEEELDVPVGDHNRCDPAPVDCGQPTHFLVRRQRFVFRATVPKDWPKDRVFSWSITSKGKTDIAKATLNPDLEIDYGVIAENSNGGTLAEGNTPPRLVKGSPAETVATLASPATMEVTFSDDGLPKPRPRPTTPAASTSSVLPGDPPSTALSPEEIEARRERQPGVRIRWVHYRGEGEVTFDPPRVLPVHGQPVTLTSKVTFSKPGTYVLRAIASDNQLESFHDTTVTVRAK
ncbi:MAG: hypothetical protein FJW27_04285 [Acidimicrobiia bacterium]|nr:hypothetical protein [Acidimicrobiia bacterium]